MGPVVALLLADSVSFFVYYSETWCECNWKGASQSSPC